MNIPRDLACKLSGLSRRAGLQSDVDTLWKALVLYEVALDAERAGDRVVIMGVDALAKTEIVGLHRSPESPPSMFQKALHSLGLFFFPPNRKKSLK